MPTWTIKGESGKGLDATVRTIQSLGIDSASVEFASLADDVFTYSMKTTSAAGAGIDGVVRIPTAGQQVELFKDGVRKFIGHAALPEIDLDRITVRVLGPWWWMSQIPIASIQSGAVDTSTSADGERPTYAFAQGDLRESLRVLNNQAKLAGVPVLNIAPEDVGDHINAMFSTLKTTISGRSWGDALAEMLNWCLDAVARYDHSGTGNPALRISRRGSMTPLSLTVGNNITECRIRPRLDLEVKRVELHYVTRNPTTGAPRWARQAHGPAEVGKLQMVPVSGPDQSDLVPPDDSDTYFIKTMGSASNFVNTTESSLVGARQKYGNQVSASTANGAPISLWRSWWNPTTGSSKPDTSYGKISAGTSPLTFVKPNGTRIDLTGRNFIITGTPPDWVKKTAGINMHEGELSGMLIRSFAQSQNASGGFDTFKVPEWVTALGMTFLISGFTETQKLHYYAKPFTMAATVVSINYSAGATLYRPWLWDYLAPPANLSENLRDCQNWVPWEGTISTIADDVSCDNVLNRKIRLVGSATVCATMDSLLKKVKYDIIGNRTTYTLGAPARIDYGTFIARLRSQKIDRIRYL